MKVTDDNKLYYLVKLDDGKEMKFDTYEEAVDCSIDKKDVMHQIIEVTEQVLVTHMPAQK